MAARSWDYPVELGLAYLLLVGYLARVAFASLRLPGPVGVFLAGFAYSYFMETDLLAARDQLQELAFFLVLLNAGFQIRIHDVGPRVLIMALVPACFELLGTALYATLVLGYSLVEGLVLGTVLFCMGEGIVAPKAEELSAQFPGNPMPRLVHSWSSLEATFALTLFGILTGVSDPANRPSADVGLLVVGGFIQVTATLAGGALFGTASGWLISRRERFTLRGRPVFTGATVEAFLLILGVALVVYSLGDGALVPLGVIDGDSLFQPELFVIVTGSFFASAVELDLLAAVEGTVSGVWVFGSVVLFIMLGSRTKLEDMGRAVAVLPIMALGVLSRLAGVCAATWLTRRLQPCCCDGCSRAARAAFVPEVMFGTLCCLPRATMQAALGALPIQQRFFQEDVNKREVQRFVASAARLYIFGFAIVGTILLELLGPPLLNASTRRRREAGACCAAAAAYDDTKSPEGRARDEFASSWASAPPLLPLRASGRRLGFASAEALGRLVAHGGGAEAARADRAGAGRCAGDPRVHQGPGRRWFGGGKHLDRLGLELAPPADGSADGAAPSDLSDPLAVERLVVEPLGGPLPSARSGPRDAELWPWARWWPPRGRGGPARELAREDADTPGAEAAGEGGRPLARACSRGLAVEADDAACGGGCDGGDHDEDAE